MTCLKRTSYVGIWKPAKGNNLMQGVIKLYNLLSLGVTTANNLYTFWRKGKYTQITTPLGYLTCCAKSRICAWRSERWAAGCFLFALPKTAEFALGFFFLYSYFEREFCNFGHSDFKGSFGILFVIRAVVVVERFCYKMFPLCFSLERVRRCGKILEYILTNQKVTFHWTKLFSEQL